MFNVLRGRESNTDEGDDGHSGSFFDRLSHLGAAIPVHGDEREYGRFARLGGRAVVIFLLGFLAYLPCLWASITVEEIQQLKLVNPPLPIFHSGYSVMQWFEPGVKGTPPLLQWLVFCEAKPGSSAFIFHFVSLTLHCLSAVMLWFVLRRLQIPVAWLAAALFAVYPANVSTVGWVNEQARVWACFFSLLGVLLLLKNRKVPPSEIVLETDDLIETPAVWAPRFRSAGTLTTAVIAFLAAALCQPSASIMIGVALIVIAWRKKLRLADWIIFAILGVPAVTLAMHSFLGRTPNAPIKTEYFSAFSRLVWPGGRMLSDTLLIHRPLIPWGESGHLQINIALGLGALLPIVLVMLIAFYRRIGFAPALLAGGFVLFLPTVIAPTALHRPENPIIFGDAYLCTIPIAIAIAAAVIAISKRVSDERRRTVLGSSLSTVLLVSAGLFTCSRTFAMADTLSLFKAAVASDPESMPAKSRLAEYYLNDPQLSQTDRVRLATAQLPPLRREDCTSATTAISYGDLQQAGGDAAGAENWYRKAESLDGQNFDAPLRLGAILTQQGNTEGAAETYKSAITRQPTNLALRNDYGLMLASVGKLNDALAQYDAAVRINPDYVAVHVNMANTYIGLQRLDDAARELQKVISLDPENFEAFHNAGVVLAQLKDYEQATGFLTAAVQLRPESAEAHNDLGVALVGAGKFDRAVFEFQQAVARNAAYDAAKHNLQIAERRRDAARASKFAIQPASSHPN